MSAIVLVDCFIQCYSKTKHHNYSPVLLYTLSSPPATRKTDKFLVLSSKEERMTKKERRQAWWTR